MKVTGLNGTTYRLNPTTIGSGGEGDIYSVVGMDYVAKIYNAGVLSDELVEKISIMIENPPNSSVLSQVAWPLDMAYDDRGLCCGFIMPRLNINAELGEIYKYPSVLPISTYQKVKIAQNICAVISEVHQAGYVFGDFNPRNIGLDTNTGFVSFLDTDTYHVSDSISGMTYRCNVCAPGYAAPELLERCSEFVASNPSESKNAYAKTPLPTFTQDTDNFALAIHVFKLLMNGYTPFGGIIETASVSQSSPGVGDAAVRRDSYCFKPGYKHQSAAILPLEAFPDEIGDLFTRAFITGKKDPTQRPTAAEWHGALARFEQNMVTCADNPLHQFDGKNYDCPLCEADRLFGEVVGANRTAHTIKQSAYATTPNKQSLSSPSSSSLQGYQYRSATSPSSSSVQGQQKTATPVQTPASLKNLTGFKWTGRTIYALFAASVAVVILIAVIGIQVSLNNTYNEAHRLLQNGHYMAARGLFVQIRSHRDSENWIHTSYYRYATSLLSAGNYAEAIDVFSRIRFYRDSEAMIAESYVQWWRFLLVNGDFMGARDVLTQMPADEDLLGRISDLTDAHVSILLRNGDFVAAREAALLMPDSGWHDALLSETYLQHARHLLNEDGNFIEARELLGRIHPFGDSGDLMNEANYQYGMYLLATNNPQLARVIFLPLARMGFRDALELVQGMDFYAAIALKNEGHFRQSYLAFSDLNHFRDSQTQRENLRQLMYYEGVEAYRNGNFSTAEMYFGLTSEVGRTVDYMTLIRARNGQWDGDGRHLLDLLDFEDTIQIINGNDILLRKFLGNEIDWGLRRRWSNAAGYSFEFFTQGGRTYWHTFSNLPTPSGTFHYYGISNGVFYRFRRGATRDQWVPHWRYYIISLNQIRIHNFHNSRNYTLNRTAGTR